MGPFTKIPIEVPPKKRGSLPLSPKESTFQFEKYSTPTSLPQLSNCKNKTVDE